MAKITFRIWLLLFALMLALLAIWPRPFAKGVVIKSIEKNSTAYLQGLSPGEIILEVNGKKVVDVDDYSQAVGYLLNASEKQRIELKTNKGTYLFLTERPPEITVVDLPKSNLRLGLDLEGGARALIMPEKRLSSQELNDLIAVMSNRLNVYGLSDVKIRPVFDLGGNGYVLVEIAGATPAELRDLIGKQGKFEAKIGNETVFVGGKHDITSVCRNDPSCAGIVGCNAIQGGYACKFRFVIYLSGEAAKRHANITSKLSVNMTAGGRYLDKKLDLYLDDKLVDSLLISADLKGRETTQIQIQGSGIGKTRQEAYEQAMKEMKRLQTILITGSLPYKLEIVKLDTVSPLLGKNFMRYIFLAIFGAIFAVFLVVFARYRRLKPAAALMLTSLSEVMIILGVAAAIKWNLDLPSIAGILATIGTGVDQQIVILDESEARELSLKERLKRALFIIVSAYFTSVVALLPLYWAGAGLLKGFAVTTIIGISAGVLITRPAFADIVRLMKQE